MELDTTNLSTINIFLIALKKESFRKLVEPRYKELNLPPPYDALIDKLLGMEGDIKHKDFVSLCYTLLPPHDVDILKANNEVSNELGLSSFETLLGLTSLDKIGHVLRRDSHSIDKKLEQIGIIVEATKYKVSSIPRAKKVEELEVKKDTSLFKYLKYPFSRGKLYLLTAYSGVGKTNLSLSLAKYTGGLGLNTHYISIADWSEAEIRNKIIKAKPFPEIWLSIFDEASLYDIELEIEKTRPDIVIVDSITDMTSYAALEQEYYWDMERKARGLRRLANKYNLVLVTTHQLIVRDEKVIPEDLLGAKAHLLKVVDLGLGIGCKDKEGFNNVSTLKVRHSKLLDDFKISIDFEGLMVYNK